MPLPGANLFAPHPRRSEPELYVVVRASRFVFGFHRTGVLMEARFPRTWVINVLLMLSLISWMRQVEHLRPNQKSASTLRLELQGFHSLSRRP